MQQVEAASEVLLVCFFLDEGQEEVQAMGGEEDSFVNKDGSLGDSDDCGEGSGAEPAVGATGQFEQAVKF